MKRRKFLGFLGGAAVAGPGMAKAAATQGIEALSVSPVMPMNMVNPGMFGTAASAISGPVDDFDPVGWARRDLARFLGKSAEQLIRERNGIQVAMLDPDIASMRSLSLGAKVRMQRERLFERQQADERGWLERRLDEVLNPPTP